MTRTGIRMQAIADKIGPGETKVRVRTLWRAKLRIQNRKDEFLFRSTEDFADAAKIAQTLLDSSPSCKMSGAEIVSIERVARLWN